MGRFLDTMGRYLALLSCVVGCGAADPVPGTAEVPVVSRPLASPKVAQGEALLTKGDVKGAWALFEEAIADDPDDARAWLDLGLVYEEEGDWSAAEKAYRRSTEIDGRFAEAFNNLGVLLRERGDLPGAIAQLERAVLLDPRFGAARFNLALAYEDGGDPEAAEREYLGAIEALPNDPVPRINLAMLYLEQGRSEDATTQLRAAAPAVEGDVLLSVAVGSALRRAGAPSDAVRVLHGALAYASDPPPTELLAELALALYAVDEPDAAIDTMKRAVKQRPNDPALQYALGTMLTKGGVVVDAKRHLRRVIKLDPDGPFAERARAQLRALDR